MSKFPIEDIGTEDEDYDHDIPGLEPHSKRTTKWIQDSTSNKEWTIFSYGSHNSVGSEIGCVLIKPSRKKIERIIYLDLYHQQ